MTRLRLTRREYDALLATQGGKCCVRGCRAAEGLIAEHSTPNALKPGRPDQLTCMPCHKVKTLKDVKADRKLATFTSSERVEAAGSYCHSSQGGASSPVSARMRRRPTDLGLNRRCVRTEAHLKGTAKPGSRSPLALRR
jgi:hypothetical protein